MVFAFHQGRPLLPAPLRPINPTGYVQDEHEDNRAEDTHLVGRFIDLPYRAVGGGVVARLFRAVEDGDQENKEGDVKAEVFHGI